jgi:ubiquinone/menaquinone biosynthesis C-methylase UbiE
MDIEYAKKILEETKNNYNLISDDFSRTRNKFWEEMTFIADYAKDNDRILDLGCGNGRLSELFSGKKIEYYGADFSEKLIEIARKRYPELNFQVSDALNLPFPDGFFDKVFSIAVLHHIPSKEFRAKFLKEIKRVLKPRGIVVLSVWNFALLKRTKFFIKSFFLKIIFKKDIDLRDVFVSWGKRALRYVHVFSKRELVVLSKEAGFSVFNARIVKKAKGGDNNILVVMGKEEE